MRTGQKMSDEQRQKIRDANKGRIFSDAHRANISASRIGMKLSASHRANLGISHFKNGKTVDANGYVRLNTRRGKLEHRSIMEEVVRRLLKRIEVVHHWNENKTDNRAENLCLFRSQSPHKRLHHFADRHSIGINSLRFEQPWLLGANE